MESESPSKFLQMEDTQPNEVGGAADSFPVDFALCPSSSPFGRPKEGTLDLVDTLQHSRGAASVVMW